MNFADQWYWCWITEDDEREEPDWSKVPEERRAAVKERWFAKAPRVRKKWKLWGPQIPMYQRDFGDDLEIIGPV